MIFLTLNILKVHKILYFAVYVHYSVSKWLFMVWKRVFFMCVHAFSQVKRVELLHSVFKKQQALSLYRFSMVFFHIT